MKSELKRARMRLMLLYMAVGILLVILVGGVSYALLAHFLQTSVDDMLRQRMGWDLPINFLGHPAEG